MYVCGCDPIPLPCPSVPPFVPAGVPGAACPAGGVFADAVVTPAAAVAPLQPDADLADVIARFNALLDSLQASGCLG